MLTAGLEVGVYRVCYNQERLGLKDGNLPNCKRACVAHRNGAPLCYGGQGDGREYGSRKELHDAARRESL